MNDLNNENPIQKVADDNVHHPHNHKPRHHFHHEEPNIWLGIMACVGGLFIHLVIGSFYQWSMVSIYFTSYHKIT
jgi:hypothetical protein